MNELLVIAVLVAGAVILWLWSQTSSLTQEVAKSQGELSRISGRIQQEAMKQFQAWRQSEYDSLRKQEAEAADREAQVKLAKTSNADDLNNTISLFDFDAAAVQEVILSAKIEDNVRAAIIAILSRPEYAHVKVLQAKLHRYEYRVEIETGVT